MDGRESARQIGTHPFFLPPAAAFLGAIVCDGYVRVDGLQGLQYSDDRRKREAGPGGARLGGPYVH